MARINNLFDSGQGKLGNLVFYKVKGQGIVRTKPEHFRDKKSTAQLLQRKKLQVVNEFIGHFNGLIRKTYQPEDEKRSSRSEAFSYNMRNALKGVYPDIYIDKQKVLLSKGPLPLPVSVELTSHPEGLLIRWKNGEEAIGKTAGDTLVLMLLDENTKYCDYKFTDVSRTAGEYVWKLSTPPPYDTLPDVWIAFRNRQETQMSNSMYAGI